MAVSALNDLDLKINFVGEVQHGWSAKPTLAMNLNIGSAMSVHFLKMFIWANAQTERWPPEHPGFMVYEQPDTKSKQKF